MSKTINPANAPLVPAHEVHGGVKPDNTSKAHLFALSSQALVTGLSNRAIEAQARLEAQAAIDAAASDYFATVAEMQEASASGALAAERISGETAKISRATANAVMGGHMSRKEARSYMGKLFGFQKSKTSDKFTSTPLEPGNTIAKRVSSLAIAREYLTTGTLPEKGGEGLLPVPAASIEAVIEEYEGGHITVRAASERLEGLIREHRVAVPTELNPDKLLDLAGKIANAADQIATCPALYAAYVELTAQIAAIPFNPDFAN